MLKQDDQNYQAQKTPKQTTRLAQLSIISISFLNIPLTPFASDFTQSGTPLRIFKPNNAEATFEKL